MIEFKNCEDITALRSLWKEAFGDTDDFLDSFFSTAFSYKQGLAAFIDNDLAGALYIFECEFRSQKIAYIYAVATAKKHRNKGVCRQLLSYTHAFLKKQGYIAAILVPGNKDLFTFYEKLGYKTCTFLDKFEASQGEKTTDIKEIDVYEYMKLRRKFLPANSVIQEKENIPFLKTLLTFYMGNNFILAARIQKNTLIAAEFLGIRDMAPPILSSLNLDYGVFRTFGCSTPFAMGYNLIENALPDKLYFAFAFD